MRRSSFLLLIILIFSITACKTRKSEVKKEDIKIETDSSSIDKENTSETTNTETSLATVISTDGSTKTKTVTISPIDNSKPSEFINNKGEKMILNNSKYVEEEKEELKKEIKKENLKSKATEKKTKNKEIVKKAKLKIKSKGKSKITETKPDYGWILTVMLMLIVLCLAGYAYYRINPASKLLNIFKKT